MIDTYYDERKENEERNPKEGITTILAPDAAVGVRSFPPVAAEPNKLESLLRL